MEKGRTGYYYMHSFSTTYDDGKVKKSRKRVFVNKNGMKDSYYKKSVVENGQENVIKEEGNRELSKYALDIGSPMSEQYSLARSDRMMNIFPNPLQLFWWPFYSFRCPHCHRTVEKLEKHRLISPERKYLLENKSNTE
ncbi:MAG: hypothetical protein QXW79_01560 [Thermoplasmata archaeon]